MATDVKDIAERVDTLRDRFTGWAMLVGTVSLVVAVWVSAPSLAIDIPLPGGAKVPLNVGYALSIGMPLLMIAYAWSIAPLLAVGRYQDSVAREIGLGNASLSTFEHLRLIGPYAERGAGALSEKVAWYTTFVLRALVLFLLPVVGQIWIARDYFTEINYFELQQSIQYSQNNPGEKDIRPRERVQFLEYLFASKPNPMNHKNDKLQAQYYLVADGTLELACRDSWIMEPSEGSPQSAQTPKSSIVSSSNGNHSGCVYKQFPQFNFWMNSWVNLISLAVVIHLAIFGFGIFSGIYFRRRLAEEMKKQHPPTEN